MRRFLPALAGVWLACQLIAAASPLTLFSERFGIDQESCCPGLAPGQVCPMHHHAGGERSTCKMESTCAHHDAALLTILAVGVLPTHTASMAATAAPEGVANPASSTRSRAVVPDVPPPQPLL